MNYIQLFLQSIFTQKFVSKNTIDGYQRDLNLFLQYLNLRFDQEGLDTDISEFEAENCEVHEYHENEKSSDQKVEVQKGKAAALQRSFESEERNNNATTNTNTTMNSTAATATSQSSNECLLYVSFSNVVNFLCYLNDRSYSVNSVCRIISALRHFYKFLLAEKIISENPMVNVISPKNKRKIPIVANENTVSQLIDFAMENDDTPGKKNYLIMEMLYGAGLRVSELISIRLEDFFRSENGLLLKIKGKGGKERIVPITQSAEKALIFYLQHHSDIQNPFSYIFPHSKSFTMHMTRQRVGQIIKEISKKAGIYVKISPHGLRHAFATHMLDNGSNLIAIKHLLGHSDIGTTQIYTHVATHKLVEVTEKYHPMKNDEENDS